MTFDAILFCWRCFWWRKFAHYGGHVQCITCFHARRKVSHV